MIVNGTEIKVIFSMDEKNMSPNEHLDFGDGFALNEQRVSVSYDGIAVFVDKSISGRPESIIQQHIDKLNFLHRNIETGVDAVYVYENSCGSQYLVKPLMDEARKLGIKIIIEGGAYEDDCTFTMPFIANSEARQRLFEFLDAKPIDKSIELMWGGITDAIKSLPQLAEFFQKEQSRNFLGPFLPRL
jgi:hypothetical protein